MREQNRVRLSGIALVVLGLSQALSGVESHAEMKKPEEYWQQTPLSFALLKKFFRSENCHASKERFIGCVQGLDQVGAHTEPLIGVVTAEQRQAYPAKFTTVLRDYGSVAVVQYVPQKSVEGETLYRAWLRQKVDRDTQIVSLTEAYEKGRGKKLDFNALIDYLETLVTDKGKRPLAAAEAISTYYNSAIDPHTRIEADAEAADQQKEFVQHFSGVGMILRKSGGKIVLSPREGGPAHKAGIRFNDVLLAVDGKTIDAKTQSSAVQWLRGTKGTRVTVTVSRLGQPMDIVITRDDVVYDNVEHRMVSDRGIKVGYIKFGSFMDRKGCTKILTALTYLTFHGAQALVLDLRDNGGGLLDQARCISTLFLGEKKIYAQIKDLASGEMTKLGTLEMSKMTELPMVTLIDAGSASASEIVAGALQDHQRSWIAGQRSFGKATVQRGLYWKIDGETYDGVTFWKTVERFYQPSGRTNQVVGIVPDFTFDPKPGATDEEKFAIREADQYTNYLPAIGPEWIQARPFMVHAIEGCMKSSGKADALYAQRAQAGPLEPDYQLLKAQDLFYCMPSEVGRQPKLAQAPHLIDL